MLFSFFVIIDKRLRQRSSQRFCNLHRFRQIAILVSIPTLIPLYPIFYFIIIKIFIKAAITHIHTTRQFRCRVKNRIRNRRTRKRIRI